MPGSLAALLLHSAAAFAAAPVIPLPSAVEETQACSFTFDRRTVLSAGDRRLERAADQLRRDLSLPMGFMLRGGPQAAQQRRVTLSLDASLAPLGPEGYRLEIGPRRIEIRAHQPAGVFYGIQTLKQMLPADVFRRVEMDQVEWSVPCAKIEDSPRFSWRGALMDVGRHFQPKEFIFKFLDLMALYKLNVFHWHLTDDTGWRLQIKRYPRLTEVSSRMDFSSLNPGEGTRSPNDKTGGFYSVEDVKEIVRYAADRFITIVPEIEMPGHAKAAIFAYPELGNKRQIEEAGADASSIAEWDNVYNVEDTTLEFLKNVLDEVLALFPGKFIHIGGDEVAKDAWKLNPKVQAKMKALGLKTEEEMQSWFIKQLDAYLTSKGRRLVGWDEILEGGLAPNATVTSWRGTQGGVAAARAGHDVVMNPNLPTYLDYYQSKPQALEPRAFSDYQPLEHVYRFEPIPAELTPEEGRRILGGQVALWGEFTGSPKQIEYMAFPRMTAFAETVWSGQGSRDFAGFMDRLKTHLSKLDALDVNYRRLQPEPVPVARWKAGDAASSWSTHEWEITAGLKDSGHYKVFFHYPEWDNRIGVQWIEIVEDGRTVLKAEQPHRPGGANNRDNLFFITLQPRTGAAYTLRASIRSETGKHSDGEILVVPVEY